MWAQTYPTHNSLSTQGLFIIPRCDNHELNRGDIFVCVWVATIGASSCNMHIHCSYKPMSVISFVSQMGKSVPIVNVLIDKSLPILIGRWASLCSFSMSMGMPIMFISNLSVRPVLGFEVQVFVSDIMGFPHHESLMFKHFDWPVVDQVIL